VVPCTSLKVIHLTQQVVHWAFKEVRHPHWYSTSTSKFWSTSLAQDTLIPLSLGRRLRMSHSWAWRGREVGNGIVPGPPTFGRALKVLSLGWVPPGGWISGDLNSRPRITRGISGLSGARVTWVQGNQGVPGLWGLGPRFPSWALKAKRLFFNWGRWSSTGGVYSF